MAQSKKMYEYQTGDFVSHVAIPKTIGILCERESPHQDTYIWSIWWLKHPDIDEFGQSSFITETYIKPFKPWPGFYKK